MVSRSMTNLTPAQLEEFESTFRHFDKDDSNTLNSYEFKAALASLGYDVCIILFVNYLIIYFKKKLFSQDNELNVAFNQMSEGQSEATFEQVINLLFFYVRLIYTRFKLKMNCEKSYTIHCLFKITVYYLYD